MTSRAQKHKKSNREWLDSVTADALASPIKQEKQASEGEHGASRRLLFAYDSPLSMGLSLTKDSSKKPTPSAYQMDAGSRYGSRSPAISSARLPAVSSRNGAPYYHKPSIQNFQQRRTTSVSKYNQGLVATGSGANFQSSANSTTTGQLEYDVNGNEVPGYRGNQWFIQPQQKVLVHQSNPLPSTSTGRNTELASSPHHPIGNRRPSTDFGVKISKLRIGIDKRLTIIDEKSSAVLKYRTPHFRAMATVEVGPLQPGDSIQIGWIQVCTDMQFINRYGTEGLTSWEFPEIVTGKYRMVSDADGKQYPWYGSKNEVATLQGPTSVSNSVTIHMNDNFFPQVTWYIPHPAYPRDPVLTFVYRKQRFLTFLALKDLNTGSYQILKTVTWSMELAIDVNPNAPLGKRARLLGPFDQESPHIVTDYGSMIPEKYALNPPNANNSQVLVWRPRYGDPSLVIPPIQTTIDMSRYLLATRDLTMKLLRLSKTLLAQAS